MAVLRSPAPVVLDPPGAVTRLGMIALATDLTSERDFARVLPPTVALHVTRVAYANPSTPENLRRMAPRLTDAAELLVSVPGLAAICYSCTSASVAIGVSEVEAAVGAVCPEVPVVTPPEAAVEGLQALGATRIALVTPYLTETTAPMADWFEEKGFEVVSAHCLGIADDRDMARVSGATIRAAVAAADRPEAEAVFLSCTALPAMDHVAELEAMTGKPTLTSNQASLWRMLHHAGVPAAGAPGRLFDAAPLD